MRDMFQKELFGLFHDLLIWMEPGQQNRKELQDLRGSMELAIETLGQNRLPTSVYAVDWNNLPGIKNADVQKLIQSLQIKAGQSLDVDRGNLKAVEKYFKELAVVAADLNAYLADSADQLASHEIYRVAYSVLLALFFLHGEAKLEAERIIEAFRLLAAQLHEELLMVAEAEQLLDGAIDLELGKFGGNLPAARAAIDML